VVDMGDNTKIANILQFRSFLMIKPVSLFINRSKNKID
jgi:hypothetical protein